MTSETAMSRRPRGVRRVRGATTAEGCAVTLATAIPATLDDQTTDPDTNVVTGQANEPTEVAFTFQCGNALPAPVWPGVSTLHFLASTDPVPDIVALAATLPPPGVLTAGDSGGAFAVATINLGRQAR